MYGNCAPVAYALFRTQLFLVLWGAPVDHCVKRWPIGLAVLSSIPARGEIFLTVNGVPLHTAFHYQSPIVLIWQNTVKKDVKSQITHPSLFCPFPFRILWCPVDLVRGRITSCAMAQGRNGDLIDMTRPNPFHPSSASLMGVQQKNDMGQIFDSQNYTHNVFVLTVTLPVQNRSSDVQKALCQFLHWKKLLIKLTNA